MWGCRAGALATALREASLSPAEEHEPHPGSTEGRGQLPLLTQALQWAPPPAPPRSFLPLSFAMLSSLLLVYSQVPCLSCQLNQDPTASPAGSGSPWHLGLGGAPDKQLEPLFAESVISKGKTETNHPMGWGGGV